MGSGAVPCQMPRRFSNDGAGAAGKGFLSSCGLTMGREVPSLLPDERNG